MTRKRTSRADPRHTATHEAGHAVIARVLALMCGGASIRPVGNERAMIHGPFECEGEWIGRAKWRSGGAVYRARIIAFMAGTEAEIELFGATQGDDDEDRSQIALMAKELYSCDLDRLRMMTRMLVRRHRNRIERVAAALLGAAWMTFQIACRHASVGGSGLEWHAKHAVASPLARGRSDEIKKLIRG